jgi:L-erythro-3,5-diaminohexanoate dehydrogenase
MFKPKDPFGVNRVLDAKACLPQQAERVTPELPIAEDELLVEVESLNIDSASFHQITEFCNGNPLLIEKHIKELVEKRGKHHNPVTGSGGMFIGIVKQIGPAFPLLEKPVKVGDRIASLVSLSLTPLHIRASKKIYMDKDRVDVDAYAILFSSGLFSVLPNDIAPAVALAVLDVAGAPAQTAKLVHENDTVVVIGGAGKSGLLCLYEAKKMNGVRTIAVDYSDASVERLQKLGLADVIIQADARNAVEVFEKISQATGGKLADVVIKVANIPETEMSCILACKQEGIVYFFSMATSFTRAALGAEGVGADIKLYIGNGYTKGHAEYALQILRDSKPLFDLFSKHYQ